MHALHYAREIFERRNLDVDRTIAGGQSVDQGGFRNLIHQGKPKKSMETGFSTADDRGYEGYGDGSGSGIGTGYGDAFVDGSGYGDRLPASTIDRQVRIGISIALTDSDLPEYRGPEDYNRYDSMDSLFAGISEARVEVAVAWSDLLQYPMSHLNLRIERNWRVTTERSTQS